MTTIAYDGKSIASDSQSENADTILLEPSIKIFELSKDGDYSFATGAGVWSVIYRFKDYLQSPNLDFPKQLTDDIYTMLAAVNSDGELHRFEDGVVVGRSYEPFAMGTGREFAMGSMLSGKSAREAVEIACKLDPHSGGEVVSYETRRAPC